MSRRLVAAIVVGIVVSACADDREHSPTSPDGSLSPNFIAGAVCRYTDVKQYARNLFGPNSTGYRLAQDFSGFPANSTNPQAIKLAFDIFAEIAKKRDLAYASSTDNNTFTSTNELDAANLTVQVINCAAVSATDQVSAFQKALESGGGYAVRGGPVGAVVNGQVTAADGQAAVNAPTNNYGAWLSNGRALFYGYPLTTLFPDGESSAGLSGRVSYNWSLIRPANPPALAGSGTVSLCVVFDDVQFPSYLVQLRVQKSANILKFEDVELDCSQNPFGGSFSSTRLGARLARAIADWVTPAPLYAAFGTKGTSPTGSAGSFSPFQVVNPELPVLAWVNPPADGTLAGIPGEDGGDVTVSVTGAEGVAWTNALLHIYGEDNNGAKVEFPGSCEETDDDGKATFDDLAAPKTGGYNLFVETNPSAGVCSADLDVNSFDKVTLPAPTRINVRP